MSPADGFLDAILADPGDDTLRLLYADWLEEHDDAERAEFIRLQVALARRPNDDACRAGCRPPHFGGCPDRRLLQRERKLWRHHGCDWEAEVFRPVAEADVRDALRTGRRLNAGPQRQALRCEWRRGFVWRVNWNCADFLRHAGALFRAQPVESVTLSDRGPGDPLGVHSVGFLWLPWPRPQDAAPGTHFWTPHSAPDVLPWPLYQAVCECRDKNVAETDDDCRRWLSAGCVRWGREEARKLRHARQEAR